MAKSKPNSDDYLSDFSEEARKAHEENVEKLFSTFPKSIDWADDMAKSVIVNMFETKDFMKGVREYFAKPVGTEEGNRRELAWAILVPLSLELRRLRQDAMSVVDGRVKYRADQLRKKFAEPRFLAEYVRVRAGELDGRGMSAEANALRDAADILSEDF